MDHFIRGIVEAVINAVRTSATFPFEILAGALADRNKVIDTASEIFREADEHSQGRLISDVLNVAPKLIPAELLESVLDVVGSVFEQVSPSGIVRITGRIAGAVKNAFIGYVQILPILKDAVFSNAITVATLELVWADGPALVRFLNDIAECAKAFVSNTSEDERPNSDDPRVKFNELDFRDRRNCHAAYCQLQRLVLSLVYIWERLREDPKTATAAHLMMKENTKLKTDDLSDAANTVEVAAESDKFQHETWMFINGIAGEYHWTRLGCQKLSSKFSRKVIGVVNRGDGILWDLIECSGERSSEMERTSSSQSDFVSRTQSSKEAQKQLSQQLEAALKTSAERIVIVAHSQGCLILRLALGELIGAASQQRDSDASVALFADLEKRLCVFTFGNPSVDWNLTAPVPDGVAKNLDAYVLRTEHFANQDDFVAKLGVLSTHRPVGDPLYGDVFLNEKPEWSGHLFGAQYSLDAGDYNDGKRSWLLACGDKSIKEVQSMAR